MPTLSAMLVVGKQFLLFQTLKHFCSLGHGLIAAGRNDQLVKIYYRAVWLARDDVAFPKILALVQLVAFLNCLRLCNFFRNFFFLSSHHGFGGHLFDLLLQFCLCHLHFKLELWAVWPPPGPAESQIVLQLGFLLPLLKKFDISGVEIDCMCFLASKCPMCRLHEFTELTVR